jgi:hypothetical protein
MMIDYEQLAQESALFPWLDSDCMADHPYWEDEEDLYHCTTNPSGTVNEHSPENVVF